MLDRFLRPYFATLLKPFAANLSQRNIPAWGIGLLSLATTLGACVAVGRRTYLLGLAGLIVAGALDLLGSAVARLTAGEPSDVRIDRIMGLLAAALIPFAFALAQPDRALAAMFLLLGLTVWSAARSSDDGVGSLLGKSELFVGYSIACLLPDWFSVVAYVTGTVCFMSAGIDVAALRARRT